MTVPYRKKVSNRRSVFGLWIPNKTVINNSKCNPSPADSAVSDSPASEPIVTPWSGRDRLKIRLTRSGSKILLLLGLGNSFNSNKTSVESGSCEEAQDCGREQISPVLGDEPPTQLQRVESPTSCPVIQIQPETSDLSPEAQVRPLPLDEPTQIEEDLQSEPQGSKEPCTVSNEQSAPLNATLVGRISRGISLTWGHPTIIRRTHLRSRPSIISPESPTSFIANKQGDGANESSDPSTTPSSSGSPIGYSTPPTPVTSAEPSPSSDKCKPSTTNWTWSGRVSDVSSTSDSGSPTITPSILTVEAASVAKVYLELYFSSIFQNLDPRVQRQHELEQHIFAFQAAPEEQMNIRRSWLQQENEYLRQCRTLKTSMQCIGKGEAVSVAGYEVIKVLGKGSFGVVRLVRERAGGTKPLTDEDAAIRTSPLDILRSAVDGTKHGRRKFMTGERKEVYAMKVIRKSDMIRNSQEGHIRAERDFLIASERSRWVVPLITSFQDVHHLYLVMDYMVGGDFLGLLIRKDILREEWTRFYVAEMILCIEEAHRLCWIHRDVKPDNFLISAAGHLKISDFGLAFNGHWSHDQNYYNNQRYSLLDRLGIDVAGDAEDQANSAAEAKKGPTSDLSLQGLGDCAKYQAPSTDLLCWRNRKERRRFAKSVVGTSQYMAPEVIRGEMYDGRCDWWSLGIILYEVSFFQPDLCGKCLLMSRKQCLYGFTPFACENRHDTKLKILQHSRTLQYPREKPSDKLVSQDAIDLIGRILQEREFRLCSPRYQANDVLTGRPVSASFLYSMDPRHRNIASYFVYPNDASDIKSHPFFRGIRWHQLHMTQPPMVPRVRNWEDTRYFDSWKSLGDIDQASTGSDSDEDAEQLHGSPEPEPDAGGLDNAVPQPCLEQPVQEITAIVPADKAQVGDKRKERKRPRDKILRDKHVGRTALEIRKRGTFLGYTYRRPKGPAMALGTDRGRQIFPHGHLTDLYVP
ncbi:hypothetical protein N7492_007962 [Penicillium capsulatum]|uniref:non-specific serine/threonine protein kinase n=1 Tax=Penicillium capsulatum TaxID=69766 RepID=A0A9W9LGA1_9EURO|nr:hypothetical protein N7492_007962 [Penicillium capsulatum]KAJ6105369.1 hypothetical protein N7512_008886 [Penicillium capsulatum]